MWGVFGSQHYEQCNSMHINNAVQLNYKSYENGNNVNMDYYFTFPIV